MLVMNTTEQTVFPVRLEHITLNTKGPARAAPATRSACQSPRLISHVFPAIIKDSHHAVHVQVGPTNLIMVKWRVLLVRVMLFALGHRSDVSVDMKHSTISPVLGE